MQNELIKYRFVLYVSVVLFLLLSLYGQLQAASVKDIHDELGDKIPITGSHQSLSGINTLVVLIPAIGPYLEVNSVTSLFKDMKVVTEEYSERNSTKVFKEMQDSYIEELDQKGEPLYLYNYNSTVKAMLNYFISYSELGSDSEVTEKSKALLSKELKLLQLISIFKTALYVVLFVLGLIGVFVFKGRYNSDK